jgi:hypothetical protein
MITAGGFMQLLTNRVEIEARFGQQGSKPSGLLSELTPTRSDAPIRWVKVYDLTKNGKLAHTSRTAEHIVREIEWRGWVVGQDGVCVFERYVKGETTWGPTHNPHRYGAPWPRAKEAEFSRLYKAGMPIRELEEYFDAASSMLGIKRRKLGLPKRK